MRGRGFASAATIVALVLLTACSSPPKPKPRVDPFAGWPVIAPAELTALPSSPSFVSARVGFGFASACASDVPKCTLRALRTSDGGAHWAPIGETMRVTIPEEGVGLRMRFADANHGWIYGSVLIETDDGGRTWRQRRIARIVPSIATAAGMVYAVGVDCHDGPCQIFLFPRKVGDASWKMKRTVLTALTESTATVTTSPGAAVFVDVHSQDKGQTKLLSMDTTTYSFASHATPCTVRAVAARNAGTVWIACTGDPSTSDQATQIYRSTDGGDRWRLMGDTGSDVPRRRQTGNLNREGFLGDLLATPDGSLYVSREKFGYVDVSTDGGRRWKTVLADVDGGGLALQMLNATTGWAWSTSKLYRTTDGGKTWPVVAKR